MSRMSSRIPDYVDGRPVATLRMDAADHGVVLAHGDGPDRCDVYGARDVWVYEDGGAYYMHYDAAGDTGWLCALATSTDGVRWTKRGPVLDLGRLGDDDSASASYGVTYRDGDAWHMFYVATPHTTPPPDRIPAFPYLTMKARSASPSGPWRKQPEVVPFRTARDTYYTVTASPGHVIRRDGEHLQFFSAATQTGDAIRRTLGIARTRDLDGPWTPDLEPIVPLDEQVENSSLYYEESIDTWFLFTNHVGIDVARAGDAWSPTTVEYTDAIWVYWTRDPNRWDARDKAVVLDGSNCAWSSLVVGLPSVLRIGDRLAVYYDALAGDGTGHMGRDIGLAWLDLPLAPPLL